MQKEKKQTIEINLQDHIFLNLGLDLYMAKYGKSDRAQELKNKLDKIFENLM